MLRSMAGKLSTDIVKGPMSYVGRKVKLGKLGPLSEVPFNLKTLAGAGVIHPVRPDKLALMLRVLARWGASPAAGIAGAAINHPDEPMVEDEAGSLTFAEVHRRSNALARGLAAEGVGEGDGIAIMCRNHRGFVEATLAISKLGATGLYMNTAFAAPQLAGVVEREQPVALIYDGEFAGLLEQAAEAGKEIGLRRFVAWTDGGDQAPDPALEDLIEAGDDRDLDPPDESSRFVILTSGLPLLGLCPFRARPVAQLDLRAAPPLRPGGDSARHAGERRDRPDRCAGDDAADPRAAEGDA